MSVHTNYYYNTNNFILNIVMFSFLILILLWPSNQIVHAGKAPAIHNDEAKLICEDKKGGISCLYAILGKSNRLSNSGEWVYYSAYDEHPRHYPNPQCKQPIWYQRSLRNVTETSILDVFYHHCAITESCVFDGLVQRIHQIFSRAI